MKLNNTYCLIGIGIVIVCLSLLYYSLGNKLLEGLTSGERTANLAAATQAEFCRMNPNDATCPPAATNTSAAPADWATVPAATTSATSAAPANLAAAQDNLVTAAQNAAPLIASVFAAASDAIIAAAPTAATTAPTGVPATTSAAPAAVPAAGPATTSAAPAAVPAAVPATTSATPAAVPTTTISSSGVSNSLVQLLPNLFQGSTAQSGSAVSPAASAPAASAPAAVSPAASAPAAVSPAASAPAAVSPAASAPTTANYADAQHQCDTGKVWNQYINQCVAQNGTNPYDNMDKYMLKTKIVPPVCPSQAQVQIQSTTKSDDTYPPCPACDRCPEPAFHCKKVPNYDSKNKNYMPSSDTDNGLLGTNSFNNSDSLPIPLLADFSAFR